MKVIKRDGEKVKFDSRKIEVAVSKALEATGENAPKNAAARVAKQVETILLETPGISVPVEKIQDLVEKFLMSNHLPETAKAYILYRKKRGDVREAAAALNSQLEEIFDSSAIESDLKRDNANVDGDTAMGTMLQVGSAASKAFYKTHFLSKEQIEATDSGLMHIHDFDFMALTMTCVTDDTVLFIKENGVKKRVTANYLDKYFAEGELGVKPLEGIDLKVLSSGSQYVDVKNCSRKHPAECERVLTLKTRGGRLSATNTHKIPVIRDGIRQEIPLECVVEGDTLVEATAPKGELSSLNLIDLFGSRDDIVIRESAEIRKKAHEIGIERFYKSFGREFVSSHDKYASLLSLSDYMKVRDLVRMDEGTLTLGVRQQKSDGIPAIIPANRALGKLMGYIYAEGNIQNKPKNRAVYFANQDNDLLGDYESSLKTLFPNAKSFYRREDGRNIGETVANAAYVALFTGPLGSITNSFNIEMPEWCLYAPDEFKFAFVGALIDSDGMVGKSFHDIRYGSVCKRFVYQLKELLWTMGIPSSLPAERGCAGDVAYFEGKTKTATRNGPSYSLRIYANGSEPIDSKKIRENRTAVERTNCNIVKQVESRDYQGYVYDLETENHYFVANGYVVHNCCQTDITKLFEGGFSTGHGFLREPNSIQSAAALTCIAIQSNQNDQHGGQSVPNFDYALGKYVNRTYAKEFRKALQFALEDITGAFDMEDEVKGLLNLVYDPKEITLGGMKDEGAQTELALAINGKYGIALRKSREIVDHTVMRAEKATDKATHQAMESLVHNLNSMHSRAGAQTPFSSINFGTDTSPEGRMVSINLLKATEEGLGEGETPIFPISILKVKEGVNYNREDTNYDIFRLACRVSAKRLFPNFIFLDSPFNLQYYKPGHPETEVAQMGCRTRVMGNVYDPTKEISFGRGNLSFTSINLVKLAIEAKGDEAKFYASLNDAMELVARQLLDRFEIQARRKVKNFPFLMGQGVWLDSDKLGPDDEVREVIKHGSLSIGFIGLAETLVALYGHHHGESDEMEQKGLDIIRFMRAFTDKKSQEHKMNFTLLATPAEGLSGYFVRKDKKTYGIIPGVTDKEYYTNSFHIPVYFPISVAKKIQKEAPFHALTNAGHITYVELDGDTANNVDAFETVVRCMHDAGIGYGSVNHPVDRDPVCGYVGVIGDTCPRCGRKEGESVSVEKLKELRKKYPNMPHFVGAE